MSHLLESVEMKALACVIRMRTALTESHVKEALTPLTQQLQLGDVGYFYTPASPELLCTDPGQLHGVMMNAPWGIFPLAAGFRQAVSVLGLLDDDYKKLLVVVTDCTKVADRYALEQPVPGGVAVAVFALGTHPDWLRGVGNFHAVAAVPELSDLLKNFSL